jgi:hypothetical protein
MGVLDSITKRYVSFALWAVALVPLIPAEVIAQCAMCRTAISSPDDPLARGINFSILLLMAMPFTLASAIGGWLFYAYWRTLGRRRTKTPTLRLVWTHKGGGNWIK